MADARHLLPWVQNLAGIDADRVEQRAATARAWSIPLLAKRLGAPRNLDDAVRVVLLVEAIERFVARGTPETKLMSKLSDVAQFEAVWAELFCASVIAGNADSDVEVVLEAGRSAGRHADMRLLIPDGPHTSVEIKAVGASEPEVEFLKRQAPALEYVIPPNGMATFHAMLETPRLIWSPAQAAELRRSAARAAATVPNYPAGLSAAAIIAHGSEAKYVRRAVTRVEQALDQLPPGDDCWVALHWSNGAPVNDVAEAIDWDRIPNHVQGIIFVGAVIAFPHRNIDVFQLIVPRGLERDSEMHVESTLDRDFAQTVLKRTEATPGIRATLVRGTVKGKRKQILRRDGSERISPFNLVLDRDPVERSSMASR